MKKILFTALILSSFFVGCKKKEDKPATAQTKTQLLTANNWVLTAIMSSTLGETDKDLFRILPNCIKDDFSKYNSNFTLIYDDGATKCNPSDPQTTNDVWSFNSDETILTVSGDPKKIETLNATVLIFSYSDVNDGKTKTYTFTYSKK